MGRAEYIMFVIAHVQRDIADIQNRLADLIHDPETLEDRLESLHKTVQRRYDRLLREYATEGESHVRQENPQNQS